MTDAGSLAVLSGFFSIEELSDRELVELVTSLQKYKRMMVTENALFENFLTRNDPLLISGMEAILEQASRFEGHFQGGLKSAMSMSMRSVSMSMSSISSKKSVLGLDKLKRINMSIRLDIINKERDFFNNSIETFKKSSHIYERHLRADLDSTIKQLSEVQSDRVIFERTIVTEGVDRITQRIPAEKFVRFMEEWLKRVEILIEKMRLRSGSLRYKIIHLKNVLKQKEELGEVLHPVDLDQLKIDNQILKKTMKQKNQDLIELKQKTGDTNLTLSRTKIFLQDMMKQYNFSINAFETKKQKVVAIQNETELVREELKIAEGKLNKLFYITQNYTAPDLKDYLRTKNDLYELKRNMKIWTRRNNLQKAALDTCIKTMKRLSGSKIENESWFIIKSKSLNEEDFDYNQFLKISYNKK